MPRKKYKPTDPKHVNPVDKMKRMAQIGDSAKRPAKKAKPRVVLGTAAARALGIGR